MVEELEVVAKILGNISDGAIKGVFAYLIFAYLKPVTICAIVSFTCVKCFKLKSKGGKSEAIEAVIVEKV